MTDVLDAPTIDTEATFANALLALQAELPKLAKDKTNPHFKSKFTGLDTIVDTISPLLAKHRLIWITKPDRDEMGPYLGYSLIHADTGVGEAGRMPLLLGKNDMQGLGSAITYARRYAITSVLNLVADEDDDGTAAVQRSAPPAQRAPVPVPDPVSQALAAETFDAPVIDPKHANEVMDAIVAKHMKVSDIKALFGSVGVTVDNGLLKSKEGLLSLTSRLTVTQADELADLLVEKTK